jgi:hypothetical protein
LFPFHKFSSKHFKRTFLLLTTTHLAKIYIALQTLLYFIVLKGHAKNFEISEKIAKFSLIRTLKEYSVLCLKESYELRQTWIQQ